MAAGTDNLSNARRDRLEQRRVCNRVPLLGCAHQLAELRIGHRTSVTFSPPAANSGYRPSSWGTKEVDMGSRVAAGVVAGLIAGVVFGLVMQAMSAPTPDGGQVPMMAMVAMVVGSTSIAVGWAYHLFNSIVIGGLFALLFGARVRSFGSGVAFGAVWGLVWWVAGALVLMPIALGMPAFAPLMMAAMRSVAIGSLAGHLIFGVALGGAYAALGRAGTRRPVQA
jgi:hypothetical protein